MQSKPSKPTATDEQSTACILIFKRGSATSRPLFDGLTVGRAGNLQLPNNPYYSRIHATFFQVGQRWIVADGNGSQSSHNGVYLNQSWRRITEPVTLRDGDRIFFLPGLRRQVYLVFCSTADQAEKTVLVSPWWRRIAIACSVTAIELRKATRLGLALRWGIAVGAAILALEFQYIGELLEELIEWMAGNP